MSRSRSKRLEPLARAADGRQQQAARLMGDAQRELARRQLRLEELLGYRSEYQARWQSTSAGGVQAARLQEYQTFMRQLEAAVRQQEKLVQAAQRECERRKQQWLGSRSRAELLERAVDRLGREERRQAERCEQRLLDAQGRPGRGETSDD